MAHASANASHTSACSELGISVGTNRTQTSLTRHATMNKWSFYRCGSIAPNATTKLMVLTAPSNNDKLGDFRLYNHSASTPTTPADFDKDWGPGGTTISLTFVTYVNEWNLREATSSSIPYISVRYYLTSTNRTNKASSVRTYTVLASETSNSPPTGHTNNQTTRPSGASQIVTDSTFPTSLITKPDDILYADIYISNSSGTEVARFGAVQADGHVDVDTHEKQNPWVDAVGTSVTRSGYTGCHTEINNVASSCTGADVPLTQGTTAYSFYLRAVGITSAQYNINPTNCTVQIIHYSGTGTIRQTITLTSQSLNTFSKNGKQFSGNVTNSFNYDDYLKVNVTANTTWGTAYIC